MSLAIGLTTPPESVTWWLPILEKYGFPVLVSVVLWVRLERNQINERADRLKGEKDRLKILKDIDESIKLGNETQHQLAITMLKQDTDHKVAILELANKVEQMRECPMVQMELFKDSELRTKPKTFSRKDESGT